MKTGMIKLVASLFLLALSTAAFTWQDPPQKPVSAEDAKVKEVVEALYKQRQELENKISRLDSSLTARDKNADLLQSQINTISRANRMLSSILVRFDKHSVTQYAEQYQKEHYGEVEAITLDSLKKNLEKRTIDPDEVPLPKKRNWFQRLFHRP